MPTKLLFENVPCRRCGGSGRFSYNSIHGDVCYGCSGAGATLTKRGEAAQKFFRDSLSKPAQDVNVGDRFETRTPWSTLWAIVERIEAGDTGNIILSGHQYLNGEAVGRDVYSDAKRPEDLVRVLWTVGEKRARRDAALAYQETLTQTGTPRKR